MIARQQPLGEIDRHIGVDGQIKKSGETGNRRQELQNIHARLKAQVRRGNRLPLLLRDPLRRFT